MFKGINASFKMEFMVIQGKDNLKNRYIKPFKCKSILTDNFGNKLDMYHLYKNVKAEKPNYTLAYDEFTKNLKVQSLTNDNTDYHLVATIFSENHSNNENCYMVYIGQSDNIEGIINLMDKYDPSKEICISLYSTFNFFYYMLNTTTNVNREMTDRYRYGYFSVNLQAVKKLTPNNTQYINYDNLKNVKKSSMISELFSAMATAYTNKQLLMELNYNYLNILIEIDGNNFSEYSVKGLKDQLNTKLNFSEEDENNLCRGYMDILTSRKNKYPQGIFALLDATILDRNIEDIFPVIIKSKYTYPMIQYFIRNISKIDKSLIDKDKFIKVSSVAEYNDFMGITMDRTVLNMADYITEAGTVIGERIHTLNAFLNSYSLEELKDMDLAPIADALNSKMVSRFEWDLTRADLGLLSNGRFKNLEYLCDIAVDRMLLTPRSISSRVKLIKNLSGKTSITNIYKFMEKSLNNSDDDKIIKAVMKYGL